MCCVFNNYWSNYIQTNSTPKDQNKIKNANEFKLIEGRFSPDEARQIVMTHFFGKIQFHNNKNCSPVDRFKKEIQLS